MSGRAVAVAAAVFAAAALVGVNVLLLGLGSVRHDPVGRLTPVATLPAGTTPVPVAPRPGGAEPDD